EVTDLVEHQHFKLNNTEWQHLAWLHGILELLNQASLKLSSSKDVTISEMLPLFNLIFDMLEDEIDSLDPVATTDNQYERQERLKGLRLARDKLSKYYAYTTTCPWYTFATSKSQSRFYCHSKWTPQINVFPPITPIGRPVWNTLLIL